VAKLYEWVESIMRLNMFALPVCLAVVGLAGCGMPVEESTDEGAPVEDVAEAAEELLGSPRIPCPTGMRIAGNGTVVDVGAVGLPRTIRASLEPSLLVCTASGAAIPVGTFTSPTTPFSLRFGESLDISVSGARVNFAFKIASVTVASSSFTCPTRKFLVGAAQGWTIPEVTSVATPTVARSASTVTVTCTYSVLASQARVTQARPSDIKFASGNGFYRSSDLTAAEKRTICSPPCNTSCTSGFTGGSTEGIAQCISSCIATCVSR
jgi:hypothetical protein